MSDDGREVLAAERLDRRWRLALDATLAFGVSLLLWQAVEETPLWGEGWWPWLKSHGREQPEWYQFWDLITCLARGPASVGLVLLAVYSVRDMTRRQVLILTVVFAGVLVAILKQLVGRERPDGAADSWPSGHAGFAFALALALQVGVRRPRLLVWSLAILLASSRVFLERHHPSDLVGGLGMALVGLALAIAVTRRLPRLPLEWLDRASVQLVLGLGVAAGGLVSLVLRHRAVLASRVWGVLIGMLIAQHGWSRWSVARRAAAGEPAGEGTAP